MSKAEPQGPIRYVMSCTTCGERTAYPTQAIADDKLELHNAFVHTAGGCPSRSQPIRIERRR
jgi:hypothetical protein